MAKRKATVVETPENTWGPIAHKTLKNVGVGSYLGRPTIHLGKFFETRYEKIGPLGVNKIKMLLEVLEANDPAEVAIELREIVDNFEREEAEAKEAA